MKKEILSILLIAIVGFGVYSNSLKGEFVWDDTYLVENNLYIRDFSHIADIFTKDILAGSGRESSFFRPLQIFSYAFDYSFWKLNVAGYHLTNSLLHILAALSIYFLFLLIFKDNLLSLISGLLFVVHPINAEAVSYISGRADLLAALFMLIAFIFYIKSLDKDKALAYLLMIISYIAALLSRENALIFPFLLVFYSYVFKGKLKNKGFISIAFIAFFYIVLRVTALRQLLSEDGMTSTFLDRLPGFFAAFAAYLRLIVLPFDLHMEYGDRLFSWGDPSVIAGIMLFSLIAAYCLKQRRKAPLVFFSLGWFFVLLLPQANLYPLTAYMAEHWVYLPSIGFFLIFAKALSLLLRKRSLKALGLIILMAILIFYGLLTLKQNDYWRRPLDFYARTLSYAPDSPRVLNNLGNLYHSLGQSQEAITSLSKAIDIDPDRAETYYNLGNVYRDIGPKEKAIELYRRALELKPDYGDAYNNLGLTFLGSGQEERAIEAFKKAIRSSPDYAQSYNNLGNAYYAMGRKDKALSSLHKALELNPDYYEAYNNLGLVYADSGRGQEAVRSYKKAIAINPEYAKAYSNLGITYYRLGKLQLSISSFKKSIELQPENLVHYTNLVIAYANLGKFDLAAEYFDKARALGLNNPSLGEFLESQRNQQE